MSMSVMGSYDEMGEARDTVSYRGAKGPPGIAGIEGGRRVLVYRVTAVVVCSIADCDEQGLRCRCP